METSKNWYVLIERNHDQVDRAVETESIQEACAHAGNSTGAGLEPSFWMRLSVGMPEAAFDVYRVLPEAEEFLVVLKNSSSSEIRSLPTSRFSNQNEFYFEGSWGIPFETVNQWIDDNETPMEDDDYSYEAVAPVSPDSMSREDAEQYLANQRQTEEQMASSGKDDIEALNKEMSDTYDEGQKEVQSALEAAKKSRESLSLKELRQEEELNQISSSDEELLEDLEDTDSKNLTPEQLQSLEEAKAEESEESEEGNA